MSDLIPLQAAQITQYPDQPDKTWYVRDNEGNDLGKLPGTLSPKEAMSYLHFARPFELEALNIGIQFGKKQADTVLQKRMNQAIAYAEQVTAENERLSLKLLQMIEEGAS